MSQIDVFTTADMRQIFTIQDGPSGNRTHKTAVQVQKFPVSLPAQTHRRLSLRGSRFYSLLTAKNDVSYLYYYLHLECLKQQSKPVTPRHRGIEPRTVGFGGQLVPSTWRMKMGRVFPDFTACLTRIA